MFPHLFCPFFSLICSVEGLLLAGNLPPGAASSSWFRYEVLLADRASMKAAWVSLMSRTRGGGAPSKGFKEGGRKVSN